VRFADAANQTLTSAGGDPSVGGTLDPIGGGGACATVADRAEPGTATWTLPAATGSGYTLLGAPTIVADVSVEGPNAQIAGRLWDVAPDGKQTLVARGVYRPDAQGRQVWQLHPGAWRFEPGHRARLQLLGRDAPYVRPSNGAFTVDVANLDLRLPVAEQPDCAQVLPPAAPVVPAGATLAPDVSAAGAPPCASASGGAAALSAPAPAQTTTTAAAKSTAVPRKARLALAARCARGGRFALRVTGADAKRVRSLKFKNKVTRGRQMLIRRRGVRLLSATARLTDGRRATLTRRAPRCR
jgi:hypothetical protein